MYDNITSHNKSTNQEIRFTPGDRANRVQERLLSIRTLRQANEYHLELYFTFIDYKKVLNSVELWAVKNVINAEFIPATITSVLQRNRHTSLIKQDVISPKLFIVGLGT